MNTDWFTSNGNYGISYYHADASKTAKHQSCAGLSRAERAYHEHGHCYPRFERQKIKALLDENILSGAKKANPEMLQRIPVVPRIHPDDRPASANSKASSQRSRASSIRSVPSARSAGSRISSRAGAPSGAWLRSQTTGLPPYYGPSRFQGTSNANYGEGVHESVPLPDKGREMWMLGRGGGQITTFENCLHKDATRCVPEIRAEPRL